VQTSNARLPQPLSPSNLDFDAKPGGSGATVRANPVRDIDIDMHALIDEVRADYDPT
jgi:hypothetical protein